MDLYLFFLEERKSNYGDDNSPFNCKEDSENIRFAYLEGDIKLILNSICQNGFKANPDIFHLLLRNSNLEHFVKGEEFNIVNSTNQRLLDIIINNKLSFDEHVGILCNKASQMLHAVSRIYHYMDVKQR